MKVVLSWLRESCPTDLEAEALADLLSVKGVHVESIARPWGGLSGVVVARVLERRAHPSSDHLILARLDTGDGEANVAAGVANWDVGDLIPYAPPGSRVPLLPEPLGVKTLRGERSEGMMCSPRELGLSTDHGGILVLPADTPLGADVKTVFGLDDAVLDIEIEPNRPDLMSVFGVAREVAALTGLPLTEPDRSLEEIAEQAAGVATVEVVDLQRCPRYLARVIRGVGVGPSPIQIQARLTAAGMRPLSNVVDATNYAMLETGQPLHPFDLALVAGKRIVVRRAAEGERLVTLDDVERTLTADDLVIADGERSVAIAGVMGSAPVEVRPGTADVLLESAYFAPEGVIRTSRRLGLATEASVRFGRGADPENPPRGADRAARLIVEWSGGSVLTGFAGVGRAPERRRVSVRPSRASALLGYGVSGAEVTEVFERLGIASQPAGQDLVEIEVPGYRIDLQREVDLIEEVVRIQGYDHLGATLMGITQAGGVVPSYALRRGAREALVRAGLRESIALSFGSAADLALMGHGEGVRVANPVSAEEPYLRTSLIPGLLRSVQRNLSRGVRSVALFEVGHVFAAGGDGAGQSPVDERESVGAVLSGPAGEALMQERRAFDFFDAKGALEALMAGLSIEGWTLGAPAGAPFHPARSAVIEVAGARVGALGELHPRAVGGLDVAGRVAAFEADLSVLGAHSGSGVRYREVPRFPPVHRDLAFALGAQVPAADVQAVLVDAAGPLLESAVLFDVFTGPPLAEGTKSLAFAVDFRAPDRTLTDDEVDGAVRIIVARLAAEIGAELRAG